MARWTGNGVANGTAVTDANVRTTGNGDTTGVTVSTAGAPTFLYADDGFTVRGGTGDIGRLNITIPTGGTGVVGQFIWHPGGPPSTSVEQPVSLRSGTGGTAFAWLRHTLDNTFEFGDIASAVPTSSVSKSPAFVNGHRYLVDYIATLHTAPTTANGRFVYRVKGLTDVNWGSATGYFYDSGYAQNLGTVPVTTIRTGKTGVGLYAADQGLYQIGWNSVTVPITTTTRAGIEALFMAAPSTGVPVGAASARPVAQNGTSTGGSWTIFGTAANHGAALADEALDTGVESPDLTTTPTTFTFPFGQWQVQPGGDLLLHLGNNGGTDTLTGTVRLLQNGTLRASWPWPTTTSSVLPQVFELTDAQRTALGAGAGITVEATVAVAP